MDVLRPPRVFKEEFKDVVRAGLFTEFQLKTLISHAEKLGFWDDVEHWKEQLQKLQKEASNG